SATKIALIGINWSGDESEWTLHRPKRLYIQRIQGMAARHVEPVVLRAAEAQICAALRQGNMRERLALGVEHHDSIELFGLAFEFVDFPAAQLGRFFLEGAIAAPAAP